MSATSIYDVKPGLDYIVSSVPRERFLISKIYWKYKDRINNYHWVPHDGNPDFEMYPTINTQDMRLCGWQVFVDTNEGSSVYDYMQIFKYELADEGDGGIDHLPNVPFQISSWRIR